MADSGQTDLGRFQWIGVVAKFSEPNKKNPNPKHLNPKPWERGADLSGPTLRAHLFWVWRCCGCGCCGLDPSAGPPKISLFYSSPATVPLFLSLWVSSCSILVVFLKARTLKCPRLGSRAVETPAALAPPALHATTRQLQTCDRPVASGLDPSGPHPSLPHPSGPHPLRRVFHLVFFGERKKALRLNHKFGPKWVNTFKH